MKNTHLHNAFSFALCTPKKLVNLRQTPRGAASAPVETKIQIKLKTEQLKNWSSGQVASLNNANFKEWTKLNGLEANQEMARLKSDIRNTIQQLKTPGHGTLAQRGTKMMSSLRQRVSQARNKINQAPDRIKKSRDKVMDKEIGKKGSAVGVVTGFFENNTNWYDFPANVQASMISFGSAHVSEIQTVVRQHLMYNPDVWGTNASGELILKPNKFLKDQVKKYQTILQNMLDREVENNELKAGEGKNKGLETFYLGGRANAENKEARKATLKWLNEKVVKQLRPGQTLFVNITSHTSPEGSASGNKALRLKRFEAKKRMFYALIAQEHGPNWRRTKGNVEFRMVEKEITPKVAKGDVPKDIQNAFNDPNNPKFAEWKKLLKVNNIADAIEKINSMGGSIEARLLSIIRLLANNAGNPKQILREYNNYISVWVRQGSAKAETWLRKNSKYLTKMPYLLRYLNKSVGRARSTVAEVVQGNPWALAAREQLSNLHTNFKGYDVVASKVSYDKAQGKNVVRVANVFKMKSNYKPNVSVTINPKNSRINIKLESGRLISVSAKSSNVLAQVENAIHGQLKPMERKLDYGYAKVRRSLLSTGKYDVAYTYKPANDPNAFSKEIKVYKKGNKGGRPKATVIAENLAGSKFRFDIAGPPKKEEDVMLAQVNSRRINQMFA